MSTMSWTALAAQAFYTAALSGQVLLYLLAGAGALLEFMALRRETAAAAVAPVRPGHAVREVA